MTDKELNCIEKFHKKFAFGPSLLVIHIYLNINRNCHNDDHEEKHNNNNCILWDYGAAISQILHSFVVSQSLNSKMNHFRCKVGLPGSFQRLVCKFTREQYRVFDWRSVWTFMREISFAVSEWCKSTDRHYKTVCYVLQSQCKETKYNSLSYNRFNGQPKTNQIPRSVIPHLWLSLPAVYPFN